MKRSGFSWILLLLLGFFGCNGHGIFECFDTPGPEESREVELPVIKKIVSYDNLDVYLYDGAGQKVIIKAGKNLIGRIELTVTDGVLTLHNKNSCAWSRPPGNPGVYIYSDSLKRVEIYGYTNIYATDTLHVKSLSLYTYGTGDFDMKVAGDSLWVQSEFISNFKMKGSVNYLSLNFTNDSQFHGKDLVADNVFFTHRGSNVIEVFPFSLLKGTIESTGSLYYYNNPAESDVKITGSGKLDKKF